MENHYGRTTPYRNNNFKIYTYRQRRHGHERGYKPRNKESTNDIKHQFIYEIHKNELTRLEVAGILRNKKIQICVDTGVCSTYLRKDLAKKDEIKPLNNNIKMRVANGKIEQVKESCPIQFKLEQLYNTIFTEEALLVENLPINMNVGFKFVQKNKAVLDFKRNTIELAGKEFETPEGNFKNPMPIPDKIIFDNINNITKENDISNIKAKFKELPNGSGLIPNCEHEIPLIKDNYYS